MFDNGYGYGGYRYNYLANAGVWVLIAAVLALVGGIVLYFTFLKKSNRGKYTGFLGWLYEFCHFRKLTIETILKITYLIGAIFITLASFALIGQNFLAFLIMLIFGNLFLRIMYEFTMITIGIWRNTKEINNTLHSRKKSGSAPSEPFQAAPRNPEPQQTPPRNPAAPATKVCRTCGNVMEADAKFCRKCGSPFA